MFENEEDQMLFT